MLPYIITGIKISVFKCCLCKSPKVPPVFPIEKKYALLMNMVTVSFFYGLAIPTLFMMVAFSFFVQYSLDRILITYWFTFPPIYDDELNLKFIRALKYAPLVFVPSFLMIVGFRDLFKKVLEVREFKTLADIIDESQ